jgi:hypothetical protein
VQTADDRLLVSRDSETTTDEEISHICPSLIHFVMTLEQQFITIDDLLTEEAVDPFTDNAMDSLVIDHKLMGSDRNYTAMHTHVQ